MGKKAKMILLTGSSRKRSDLVLALGSRLKALGKNGSGLQPSAHSLQRPCGLTLIEVLISVILLAGGTVLVMQSFATGWEAIVRADERTTAYLFALSKLADLELANQQGRELSDRINGSFRAEAKPFTWRLDAVPDGSSIQPPTQVTLSVSWPRGKSTDEAQFSVLLPPLRVEEKNKAGT